MLVHPCMVGYGPKDSPRPVFPAVSLACTTQTRENYWYKLISLSQARLEFSELKLISDFLNPQASVVNLYSSEVICKSIQGSTLNGFLQMRTPNCWEESDEFWESSKRMASNCNITPEWYRTWAHILGTRVVTTKDTLLFMHIHFKNFDC